jgi:hypothetical protein
MFTDMTAGTSGQQDTPSNNEGGRARIFFMGHSAALMLARLAGNAGRA